VTDHTIAFVYAIATVLVKGTRDVEHVRESRTRPPGFPNPEIR
jgi:hypothetical protein